jgi:hypothetical protein
LFGLILVIAVVVYYASTYMQSQEPLPMPMPQAGGWLKGLLR